MITLTYTVFFFHEMKQLADYDNSPSGSRSLVTPYSLSMMWKARSILSLTSLLSTCRQSKRSGLKNGESVMN